MLLEQEAGLSIWMFNLYHIRFRPRSGAEASRLDSEAPDSDSDSEGVAARHGGEACFAATPLALTLVENVAHVRSAENLNTGVMMIGVRYADNGAWLGPTHAFRLSSPRRMPRSPPAAPSPCSSSLPSPSLPPRRMAKAHAARRQRG